MSSWRSLISGSKFKTCRSDRTRAVPPKISGTVRGEQPLSLRRQSEGYSKHNAASWKYADVIATSDRCRAGGMETIVVARAVSLDRLGKSRASDGVATEVVLVAQVVE